MTRSISASLAPIVERLELERPAIVTTAQITEYCTEAGVRTPGRIVAQRLSQSGWLLRTGQHGVWEFAPAERAGPFSAGGPLIPLLAARAADPLLPAAAALGTALYLQNLSDRNPLPVEVAVPRGFRTPIGLKRAAYVVYHGTRLTHLEIEGVPVHRPASVLVHLVERPTDVRSWGSVLSALPALVERCDEPAVRAELTGRTQATRVRLAYLLQGLQPDWLNALDIRPGGRIYFGPRQQVRRHDTAWEVADTILPFSPKEIRG